MASNDNTDNLTVSDLFDQSWTIQKQVEKNTDTDAYNNNYKYREDLRRAINYLEKCDYMLDELHLFSENETIDEISTKELRYFLHSALLAWLLTKQPYNAKTRLETILKARHYYSKFLNLTRLYSFHNYKIETSERLSTQVVESKPQTQDTFDKNLVNMAYDRNEKIKRFKEQKEIEKLLELMEVTCNRPHVDDEQRREYYMTCIRFWVNRALEEYKFVLDEAQMLKMRDGEGFAELEEQLARKPKQEPMKPYILTRDAIQSKVIGMGYPSLPVYSIEEFYGQLVGQGFMPDPCHPGEGKEPVVIGGGVTDSQKEDDKVEKEKLADADDDEELKKQREWDEWKDDNKRGAGNRYNRS